MLTILLLYNLVLVLQWSIPGIVAQTGNGNWTYCTEASYLQVQGVERWYQQLVDGSGTYLFNITGTSPIELQNVSNNAIATSFTTATLGLWQIHNDQGSVFCEDVLSTCPILTTGQVMIEKTISLQASRIPLGDIIANYRALSGDDKTFTCLVISPVGYQHPQWRQVFLWIPVGIAIIVATNSFISSGLLSMESIRGAHEQAYLGNTSDSEDIPSNARRPRRWQPPSFFTVSSNYAIEPEYLRFKTPSFTDVIYHMQFLVAISSLTLAYPKFYVIFANNFAWASLLYPYTFLQNVIDTIYQQTYLTASGMPTYNTPGQSFNKRFSEVLDISNSTSVSQGVSTTPVTAPDVVGTGVNNLLNATNIDARAMFLSTLLSILFVFAALLLLLGICLVVMECLRGCYPHRYGGPGNSIWSFCAGMALRLILLFFLPLVTASLYQLMTPAPWYMLLSASMILVGPLILLPSLIGFHLLRIRPPTIIFDDLNLLLKIGPLYNLFTDETFGMFIWFLVNKFLIGMMVALFQSNGIAQLVVIILLEVGLFLGILLRMPFAAQTTNYVQLVFTGIRIIVAILSICFIPTLSIPDYTKQIVAYVQVVLHAVIFAFFLAMSLTNLVLVCSQYRQNKRRQAEQVQSKPQYASSLSQRLSLGPITTLASTARPRRRSNTSYFTNPQRMSVQWVEPKVDDETPDSFGRSSPIFPHSFDSHFGLLEGEDGIELAEPRQRSAPIPTVGSFGHFPKAFTEDTPSRNRRPLDMVDLDAPPQPRYILGQAEPESPPLEPPRARFTLGDADDSGSINTFGAPQYAASTASSNAAIERPITPPHQSVRTFSMTPTDPFGTPSSEVSTPHLQPFRPRMNTWQPRAEDDRYESDSEGSE
ncbi:hypothetical protein BZG36_05577 [Bifiguratus adelaidae]|uniref:TRP C-terminal domain-containing protein n=1 Tax=Bifiguratus adelaidae TaxID=1938954 RepID=A0A261XT18_9FUNG|nr:hypothetical protein BZG36_05577 [Bifiguratus adelaidae]